MILKWKDNDIALRSLGEILDDIQTQGVKGNFGFIFSSTYTINPYVELMHLGRSFNLLETFKRISANVITLFLLPPPARFSGNYRSAHAEDALELMKAKVFVWFDRVVHSKFLLFWSFNDRQFIRHHKYYGSTNFTKGGLITNIEEFYHNRRNWERYPNPPKYHAFYLDRALKIIDEIIKLYESPDYWAKRLSDFQGEIPEIIKNLKQKALTAKDTIEKLKLSMFSYSYMLDALSDLWNLPGKQFAYRECEKILPEVDDYAGFNLEFLEELTAWPNETIMNFIDRWKINVEEYFRIPDKVIYSLSILRKDLDEYRERGYKYYLFNEEKELIEHIKSEQSRKIISVLRELIPSSFK
jgi:hypothetical protein